MGIPQPTATTWDGENTTLLWALDTPIEAHEIHIYALLERCLHEAARDFKPTNASFSNIFLTRLIGSKNSRTCRDISIAGGTHKTHNRTHLENCLLNSKSISIGEYKKLEQQAGIMRELLALFSERVFDIPRNPNLFDSWIKFFGAALSEFCSPEELKNELVAISESLESQPWKNISYKYAPLIDNISKTTLDGCILHNGKEFSIHHHGWLELLRRELNVTKKEVYNFKLYTLGGARSASPHLTPQSRNTTTFGTWDFVPTQSLLLKAA